MRKSRNLFSSLYYQTFLSFLSLLLSSPSNLLSFESTIILEHCMGIPDSMLNVDIEADRDALTDPFPHSTSFPIGKERCGDSDENGDGDGKITLCDSQKPKTLSVVADYPLETSFPWRIRLLLPSKQSILALLFGQLLSVLITCTGISSQLLAEFGVDAPTTQSLLNYVLLSGYLIVLIYRGTLWSSFKSRWWKYLILAFFDVEANYLVVKAYQFTTITRLVSFPSDCQSLITLKKRWCFRVSVLHSSIASQSPVWWLCHLSW